MDHPNDSEYDEPDVDPDLPCRGLDVVPSYMEVLR